MICYDSYTNHFKAQNWKLGLTLVSTIGDKTLGYFLNQKVDWLLLVTEKNDFAHSKFILLGKNSLESFYPKTVSVSEKGQID